MVGVLIGFNKGAFAFCNGLKSVTIGESVTFIGRGAFMSENLESVIFSEPNGWWVSSDRYAANGSYLAVTNLQDDETVASYFKSYNYYGDYYWKRT